VRDDVDRGRWESERLQQVVRAARELSDALWDSLQHELSEASSERVRALAQRLGEVSSTVALLLGEHEPAAQPTREAAPAVLKSQSAQAVSSSGESPVGEPPAVERRTPPEPVPPPRPSASFAPGLGEHGHTRLVDERESATVTPFAPPARGELKQSEIEIHDVRREEGSAAWISSVGRMLARHREDYLPFAVLLIEIVDVAHLERSETPHDLHGIVAQVESALGRGMRASDELSRETLGRYWLLAPDTNGTGARMLAERLARLVRSSATHRNVPMEVAIGISVCPEDGVDAPALAAHADLGVYSARATGRSIAHTEPPPR
jgi:GGDEF domain-containing protein